MSMSRFDVQKYASIPVEGTIPSSRSSEPRTATTNRMRQLPTRRCRCVECNHFEASNRLATLWCHREAPQRPAQTGCSVASSRTFKVMYIKTQTCHKLRRTRDTRIPLKPCVIPLLWQFLRLCTHITLNSPSARESVALLCGSAKCSSSVRALKSVSSTDRSAQ